MPGASETGQSPNHLACNKLFQPILPRPRATGPIRLNASGSQRCQIMDQNTELKNGAAAFAQTLMGPAGRISFDTTVGQHLDWFSTALARGLSWHQIIELLRRAGVTRDDGRPLARGHLSAVYSRQRRKIHQPPRANRSSDRRPLAPDRQNPRGNRTLRPPAPGLPLQHRRCSATLNLRRALGRRSNH